MDSAKKTKLARSAFTAAFAALTCAGTFVSIPLSGGVPVTIQNMFAALSGLVLGGLQGAGAVGLFLLAGALGLPVFAGCRGGVPVMQGPTGGFLLGYFLGALVGGLILGSPLKKERKDLPFIIRAAVATLAAYALQYLAGIPWFMVSMEAAGRPMGLGQALSAALLPFIPGDCIKMLLSLMLALALRPAVARRLYPDDGKEADEILRRLQARGKRRDGR